MTKEQRAQLVRRDKEILWHPYTPMQQYRESVDPLVVVRAAGSRLFDADGRSILDGNASWWTALLGHNHPRLTAALKRQAETLCHTSLAGITHEPAVMFADELLKVAPPGDYRVFFSDNGSTAVEAAMKLAVQYFAQRQSPHAGAFAKANGKTAGKKSRFLSLEDAFHGETLGVTSLSGVEAFRAPFSEVTIPVIHLPSPAEDLDRALSSLREVLKKEADTTAALIIEPLLQGAGGMKIYDAEYLREARALTEKYDVLLIADEVFTGYGRTGTFWAMEQAGVSADLICSAKGLSGGLLPFAATLISSALEPAFLGDPSRAFYYGHTFCGNPLGAAVAREVLRVYEDEQVLLGIPERARMIEETMRSLGEEEGVTQARALGMCGAVNLGGSEGYLARAGWDVFHRALKRNVYVRPLGNVVYVTPPLNIALADLRELLTVVALSVREVVSDAPLRV